MTRLRSRTATGGVAARAGVAISLGVVSVIVLGFLAVPILALVVYQPPARVWQELGSAETLDALAVTAKTNAIALAVTLALGTPFAYAVGRARFRGRALLITLLELPLVLPPAVAGIALLVSFGRLGLLGGALNALGISLGFTQAAVVMAIVFVSGPFYLRGAVAAFETLDTTLLDAATSLGAGQVRRTLQVAIPLAASGLGAAAAMCLARGIGEFGATIMFAGSFQGHTQTLPLAVYSLFGSNLDQAVAVGVLLLALSGALLLALKLAGPRLRGNAGR